MIWPQSAASLGWGRGADGLLRGAALPPGGVRAPLGDPPPKFSGAG